VILWMNLAGDHELPVEVWCALVLTSRSTLYLIQRNHCENCIHIGHCSTSLNAV
jgi:hypothetical protein